MQDIKAYDGDDADHINDGDGIEERDCSDYCGIDPSHKPDLSIEGICRYTHVVYTGRNPMLKITSDYLPIAVFCTQPLSRLSNSYRFPEQNIKCNVPVVTLDKSLKFSKDSKLERRTADFVTALTMRNNPGCGAHNALDVMAMVMDWKDFECGWTEEILYTLCILNLLDLFGNKLQEIVDSGAHAVLFFTDDFGNYVEHTIHGQHSKIVRTPRDTVRVFNLYTELINIFIPVKSLAELVRSFLVGSYTLGCSRSKIQVPLNMTRSPFIIDQLPRRWKQIVPWNARRDELTHCSVCGYITTLQCRCKTIFYCSKICQKYDFEYHKNECSCFVKK